MQNLSLTDFVDLKGSDSLELLTNDRIATLTALKADRVFKSTRVNERYILKRDKEPVDLAHEVLEKFLQKTGIASHDIAALTLVHTDYSLESLGEMAESVGKRIGLHSEAIHSLSLGCVGFVRGLTYAASVAQDIPEGRHCVLINVETPDRYIDARDSRAAPIFAAGATATSLWKGKGHSLLFSASEDLVPPENSKDEEIFKIEEADAEDFFGMKKMKTIVRMNGDLAYLNGSALIERATRLSLERVMQDEQYRGRRVIVVPHQANAKMINAFQATVAEPLRIERPEWNIQALNFVNGMEGISNVISCTIPSVLSRINDIDALSPPQNGDIVLIPAAGICMDDPGKKMSMGVGAIEWHPEAYKH